MRGLVGWAHINKTYESATLESLSCLPSWVC
nr:MAG TPA: hypothetical protein [Caudoviricetes sp.]